MRSLSSELSHSHASLCTATLIHVTNSFIPASLQRHELLRAETRLDGHLAAGSVAQWQSKCEVLGSVLAVKKAQTNKPHNFAAVTGSPWFLLCKHLLLFK